MNTRYNIGDKVILKGHIDSISIDEKNTIYTVSMISGCSHPQFIRISENTLKSMNEQQEDILQWKP